MKDNAVNIQRSRSVRTPSPDPLLNIPKRAAERLFRETSDAFDAVVSHLDTLRSAFTDARRAAAAGIADSANLDAAVDAEDGLRNGLWALALAYQQMRSALCYAPRPAEGQP
ncbi:MAG: hypothetical protein U1E45_14360 [Geminicoccaceae bacterium]